MQNDFPGRKRRDVVINDVPSEVKHFNLSALSYRHRDIAISSVVVVDSPHKSTSKSEKYGEIERLLDSLTAPPLAVQLCVHCGSQLLYLHGQFFLPNETRNWKVSIPVCPSCEKRFENLEKFFPHSGRRN